MNITRFLFGAAIASTSFLTQAACPSWPTAERFSINGAEVTDKRTGLVWARCRVGESWNGTTCTGVATTMSHETALQHAATQSGWRLPSVKELFSLADRGCSNPSIDLTAFPSFYHFQFYWSSSPKTGDTEYALGVNFIYGFVDSRRRSDNASVAVWLVRASQ